MQYTFKIHNKELTPGTNLLLKNQIVPKLVKEPPEFYGSRTFFTALIGNIHFRIMNLINLLKTKRNLPHIRSQSVPRSKHFLPRL